MAESQSKIDAAAEKAFAHAAEKKAAATAKHTPAPSVTVAAPPVVETTPAQTGSVEAPKAVEKAAFQPTRKPAVKKAVVRKAASKVKAKKPVLIKPAKSKAPAKKLAPASAKTIKITKPVTTITQLKDKIMATTKTTDFTKTAQDTVAELQARAKAAYEKGTELTADVTAFHKGNFDALVEAGKVLAAGVQDMGRTVVEDAKSAAETVTADVKAIAAVKSPTELFTLQGEIARRNLDTLVAKTSKNAEVMMKLANDMFAPISTRASVAMEKLTKAA